MAGTAVNLAPAAGTAVNLAPAAGTDIPAGRTMTPSLANSFRISTIAHRLASHVRVSPRNDFAEFFNLCVSLARGIDYAVANNDVPGRAHELPFLLKQVCQRRNDSLLQVALMVLMISAKSACKMGWFSAKDSEELLQLANEMGSSFCSASDMNTEASTSHSTISTIMSRFYPQMKMGQILAFLEAKPGYGAFVADFHLSKNVKYEPEDKIRLFVAQTDNIETSACIISPPQVNFLLNGRGVESRTAIMDTGPQMPTTVSNFLKFGTNLLQAVGQFNGNYIIFVAFMSVIPNPECPVLSVLQDYIQPAVSAMDSDSDIIEGPSRISLNCPISFRRIKTPVKGHSCKHLQCFDFDNFVNINSRRPSWRCPHCNQYVCYTDIRVDQNMVKVLREVGENVSDVLISADGSWKTVTENNDQSDRPRDETLDCQLDGLAGQEPTSLFDTLPDILDLTEGGDEMDIGVTHETEDTKPFLANPQSLPIITNPTILTSEDSPNNLQLHFGNSILSNEYGRFPSIPVNVTRTPTAVQALPAPTQTPTPPQISRNSFSNMNLNGPLVSPLTIPVQPSTANAFGVVPNNVERQQQFSRSHLSPLHVSHVPLSSLTQNWDHQEHSMPNQPAQQIVGLPAPPQFSNQPAHRVPSTLPLSSALPSPHHHPSLNPRMSHSARMMVANQQVAAHMARQPLVPTQTPRMMVANNQVAAHMARQPLVPTQTPRTTFSSPTNADVFRGSTGEQRGNTGVTVEPVLADEQNWRPTGRMRGSLSGQAYSDALNQFIIQPTQPAQATRPPPPPPGIVSQLPGIINSRNALTSQTVNFPLTQPTSVTGGSSLTPDRPVE